MAVEQLDEVLASAGPRSAVERGLSLLRGVGQDDTLDERAPLAEEHVLGAAQPDPLGSHPPCAVGVRAGVGVGPHPQSAYAVGVREQPVDCPDHVSGALVDLLQRGVQPLLEVEHHRGGHAPGARRRRPRRSSRRWRARRPRCTVTPPAVATSPAASTSSDSAPQTAVLPMPRATTAACEVLPPRLVRMPVAAIMPSRSSGLVSLRTRSTRSPRAFHSTAVAESKTTLPTAAPGEAAMPLVKRFRSADAVELREHQLRQLGAGDPFERLVHGDQLLVDELGCDPEGRRCGALADAGLEHPQLAPLDGELDVAQVAVVGLERAA